MMENNKINTYKKYGLLVVCLAVVIIPLYLFFGNEYYYQAVDLERIERIKLTEDLTTIRDFQPEGMVINWRPSPETDWQGQTTVDTEFISARHVPSNTNVYMVLYKSREKAVQGYISHKNIEFNRPQYEKKINPNDAYFISKVKRLREAHTAGLFKSNQYISGVVIIKNNLIVEIFSSYDETGSQKQVVIDIITDYLEKKAAKENLNHN